MEQRKSQKLLAMHWDITKLLELGVDEKFLYDSNITPEQARDLVKGSAVPQGALRRR
ncbi:hypothetical protein [Candidatus Nitrososphaera sp. FF02]|uniref:hypothetical protein n=1 Tax=Candidatus Nitrososphaera sp. FF02 TaxID=3398226 RepID=UPI0039E8BDF4